MTIEVLDPSHEAEPAAFVLPRRPTSLNGATVGFVSNGKEGTKGFFAHLERLLRDEFGVADVVWRTKSNYSAPAETAIIAAGGAWDYGVTGLGD